MREKELNFTAITVPPAVEEEFSLLMSMALDGLMDEEDAARFEQIQLSYPALAQEWEAWQMLDSQLREMPPVMLPPSFMASFDLRLAQQERRRRLWWGMGFGAMAVVLVASLLVGAAALGAFVMLRQPDWLTQVVHGAAFGYATVAQWFATVESAASVLVRSDQMRMLSVLYALTALAMLGGWVHFLRRTTRTAVGYPAA